MRITSCNQLPPFVVMGVENYRARMRSGLSMSDLLSSGNFTHATGEDELGSLSFAYFLIGVDGADYSEVYLGVKQRRYDDDEKNPMNDVIIFADKPLPIKEIALAFNRPTSDFVEGDGAVDS